MNPLFLPWCLLTIVGNLPEELIVKILYQYSGLRHPIVNILLNINNKRSYFKECISYIEHKEYSWREHLPIPKQVGYTFNVGWKLNRSKYILESITCKICGKIFDYNTLCLRQEYPFFMLNGRRVFPETYHKEKYTYTLMKFEKYIENQERKKLPFGTHSKYYSCFGFAPFGFYSWSTGPCIPKATTTRRARLFRDA